MIISTIAVRIAERHAYHAIRPSRIEDQVSPLDPCIIAGHSIKGSNNSLEHASPGAVVGAQVRAVVVVDGFVSGISGNEVILGIEIDSMVVSRQGFISKSCEHFGAFVVRLPSSQQVLLAEIVEMPSPSLPCIERNRNYARREGKEGSARECLRHSQLSNKRWHGDM